ncbi:zf-CCHC domain-containing protein [Tanacetum coccineum]|uniref:Zf-CCHC domain-containing protein n=1 Tax=Tanacetum coccineum TaxID=301880 RepID=A0ABQ5GYS2_9ASTR
MQRPPLFEANCFIYWKTRFETYVKSKDIDLWYIIVYGNYKPTIKDKDGKDVTITYEKFDENHKKMISKKDEAKMVLRKNFHVRYGSRYLEIFNNYPPSKRRQKEKDDRRCFNCGDPNHFISDCPKHSFNDQKAFVVGCWSDSEDDSKKEEICLMALDNNEVLSDTPYYSSSSLDNESWQNEYDKLCKISLRIINKNKQLKAKNEVLKKEACELKTKVEQLERNKDIGLECESCVNLQSKISSLTLKLASFKNSSSSLQDMLEMKKPPKDKHGIGYTYDIASTSNTETKKLSLKNVKMLSVEPELLVPSARELACSDELKWLSAENT